MVRTAVAIAVFAVSAAAKQTPRPPFKSGSRPNVVIPRRGTQPVRPPCGRAG